jgi:hypothetical protein
MATFDPALSDEFPQETAAFYQAVMLALNEAELPFLVGGAFALGHYAGIFRHTKDLDLFVRKEHVDAMLEILGDYGYRGQMMSSVWLAKARCGEDFIDLIFNSGNGLSPVDDTWFDRALPVDVFGVPTLLCPVEEVLWTKAYLMERERYDGADVAHLIHEMADRIDWKHLVALFDNHWRVLLSHLILFGFIYPAERERIPRMVIARLLERLVNEEQNPPADATVCRGTLLSRHQYMVDVEQWGYDDARVSPYGQMTLHQAICLSLGG